jgi:hypothetical protein
LHRHWGEEEGLNHEPGICQFCGSGMFIPDPDFCPSRIPDPKTATKERTEKKFVAHPFFVAKKITKLNIILILKED